MLDNLPQLIENSTKLTNVTVPAPDQMFGVNLTAEISRLTDTLDTFEGVQSEAERLALEGPLKAAKSLRKRAADVRLSITRIIDEFKAKYTDAEKAGTAALDKAIAKTEADVKAYLKEQDRLAEVERQRIIAEQQKIADRKRIPESKAAVEAQTEQLLADVAAAGPTGGVMKKWVFEVVQPASVPALYTTVNEVAIRKAIQEGVREIPGVRIYQESVRSGR